MQISLAVGPTVPGKDTKGDQEGGRGYSSNDIGARGGVAAGIDKYYVSRVHCLNSEFQHLLKVVLRGTDAMSSIYVPFGDTTGAAG